MFPEAFYFAYFFFEPFTSLIEEHAIKSRPDPLLKEGIKLPSIIRVIDSQAKPNHNPFSRQCRYDVMVQLIRVLSLAFSHPHFLDDLGQLILLLNIAGPRALPHNLSDEVIIAYRRCITVINRILNRLDYFLVY